MLRVMLAGALAVVLSACASEPTAPAEAGLVRAEVAGPLAGSFEGHAWFSVGESRPSIRPPSFVLRSEGRAPEAGIQRATMVRAGATIPAPGTYRVGEAGGFTATFEFERPGSYLRYRAVEGEVEITEASERRVEGRFRFTGALLCEGGPRSVTCFLERRADPPVAVSGTFVAVRR